MIKRDKIFFTACGLFAVGLAGAVGSVFFFHLYRLNQGSIMVFLLLPVPMIIAAGCLWYPSPKEPNALPLAR